MKTNVYVDGFNFYYGAVKGTSYKWLDLAKLCQIMLPQNTIHRIRYFTALVQPRPNDPQQQQRQQTYIRALETIPELSVHYGHFLSHPTRMPVLTPTPGTPRTVAVMKTEEKGSDVNIATHLLVDAFDNDFEVAVVLSNDSDLELPIRIVQQKFGFPVGILNGSEQVSRTLLNVGAFYKQIRTSALRRSQFPPALTDVNGTITKPPTW